MRERGVFLQTPGGGLQCNAEAFALEISIRAPAQAWWRAGVNWDSGKPAKIVRTSGGTPVNYPAARQTKIAAAVIVLSMVFRSPEVCAQPASGISLPDGTQIAMDRAKGNAYSVLLRDGKLQSMHSNGPDSIVHLIVTFKDQPLVPYRRKSSLQKSSLVSDYASLQNSHASFRAALNAIRQQLSIQSLPDHGYTITRDFYRALNGVALQCRRGMIARIRGLSMVKSVSGDGEVHADLKESVHQIRADIVQDSLGLKGDGVLVGEIDSGIDYGNPALGGGFGPAFRVIGGYDFVNNDNDPMDDEGHGTHVAGIIGANGGDSLRGVAPDVKFLAVKVLDANGSGTVSNVLAGIEYCLDPDNNPETDDGVDVINLSLGGTPSADDPLEGAIANATNAGVLCVVAAGNRAYLGYGGIQSPGTSESALTVGATVAPDAVAGFSSLGPDPMHSSIKPEVVAPGVLIVSTTLDNQTVSWSGTSMAAPHVTGVAALLRQEHPSWTPEELKAAIVNSAHSVGDEISVFAQGKGCVDALDAARARLVVNPGVVSFGLVDLAQDIWLDTLRLTVGNFRSVAQSAQISVDEGLPAGTTLTFDKTMFSVAPDGTTTVMAILAVPSSVPVLTQEPFAYLGTIRVTTDSDRVVVPFCFLKASKLIVTFDAQAAMVTLLDRTQGRIVSDIGTIPEGAVKFSYTVPREDVLEVLALLEQQDSLGATSYSIVDHKIDNADHITFVPVSISEARMNVIDTVYDIHGNRVVPDSIADVAVTLRMSLEEGDFFWALSAGMGSYVFISSLDSSIVIEKEIRETQGTDVFLLRAFARGLRSRDDLAIGSGASNLVGYPIGSCSYDDPYLEKPPSSLRKEIVPGFSTSWWSAKGGSVWMWSTGVSDVSNLYVNRPGVTQGLHDDSTFYASMFVGIRYWPDQHVMFRTPDFSTNANGEAVFELQQMTRKGTATALLYEAVKAGDTIRVEQNAHVSVPDGMAYIRNGSLFIHPNNTCYHCHRVMVEHDKATESRNGGMKPTHIGWSPFLLRKHLPTIGLNPTRNRFCGINPFFTATSISSTRIMNSTT